MVGEGVMNQPSVNLRKSVITDADYMAEWFKDPEVKFFFPMDNEVERKDAAIRWVSFCRYDASITAELDGQVVGVTTLYLQPYRRLMHNSEMGIIVAPGHRGKGIGTLLLSELIKKAKNVFGIEILHLQVYPDNPAVNLYKKFGFTEFGMQKGWIKDENGDYHGRLFMEKDLRAID